VTSSRARYFFLSYAHSPPLAGMPATQPDGWVRSFARNLTDAVARRASLEARLDPGFADLEIPVGADWKAEIVAALGTAEVFVPLLSPAYLTRSWPWREWTCFERRLEMADVEGPGQRFVPVLWVPLPSGERPADVEAALAIAPDDPTPYAENGLLALRRLQIYRTAYDQVVDNLARRIVDIAESDPIGPSSVPEIDQVGSPEPSSREAATFTVVVAAPVFGGAPTGVNPSAYGKTPSDWRPFPAQEAVPLAEYARTVAEQLDFLVHVVDISAVEPDALTRGPGIVLIDPWYLSRDSDREILAAFIENAPSWILPVLVSAPGTTGPGLAADATRMLSQARPSASRQAKNAMHGFATLDDLGRDLPFLVTEASGDYLRNGPIHRSGTGERRVRGRATRLYREGQNPAKERPDA
jgi:FxsC-like protein